MAGDFTTTRREAMALAGAGIAAGYAGRGIAATKPVEPVAVHWLGNASPQAPTALTWGIPWPRGALARGTALAATTADGRGVPLQSWPLAFWPDGSLKWTGHAASGALPDGEIRIAPGKARLPGHPVSVSDQDDPIVIKTGAIE